MKAYYTQDKIASSLQDFFVKIFSFSKPHLKIFVFIITGMISAESVVTSDIARKLKDDFSLVHLESIERRFRRFFNSFSSKNYHVIFLADRWFPNTDILSHIQNLGCFYCFRSKSFFTFSYFAFWCY